MSFFMDVLTIEELKSAYRRLVMSYHPDRGGSNEIMKQLNYEYAYRLRKLGKKPRYLSDMDTGHIVLVNNSRCVVTEVFGEYFKARSIETSREAYFSKSTGYAMLNFNFKAKIPE
jgi:hypothetical protein